MAEKPDELPSAGNASSANSGFPYFRSADTGERLSK